MIRRLHLQQSQKMSLRLTMISQRIRCANQKKNLILLDTPRFKMSVHIIRHTGIFLFTELFDDITMF